MDINEEVDPAWAPTVEDVDEDEDGEDTDWNMRRETLYHPHLNGKIALILVFLN